MNEQKNIKVSGKSGTDDVHLQTISSRAMIGHPAGAVICSEEGGWILLLGNDQRLTYPWLQFPMAALWDWLSGQKTDGQHREMEWG